MPIGFIGVGPIIKCGLTVAGCLSVPIIANSLSKGRGGQTKISDTSVQFYKEIDLGEKIGPILTCESDQVTYEVYLVPEESRWIKKGEVIDVSLKIIESSLRGKRLVGGPGKDLKNGGKGWEINFTSANVAELLLINVGNSGTAIGAPIVCQKDRKIYSGDNSIGFSQKFGGVANGIVNQKVQLKTVSKTCPAEVDGPQECEVRFFKDGPFEWDKKPKIKINFSASGLGT